MVTLSHTIRASNDKEITKTIHHFQDTKKTSTQFIPSVAHNTKPSDQHTRIPHRHSPCILPHRKKHEYTQTKKMIFLALNGFRNRASSETHTILSRKFPSESCEAQLERKAFFSRSPRRDDKSADLPRRLRGESAFSRL